MTLPSLLLGILISTLYAAVFHLWKRGGLGRLLFYFAISWVGFWAGHILAERLGWQFDSLGPLHLGTATLGSFIFLFIGYWLSLTENTRQ